MAKAKKSIAAVSGAIYKLLEPQDKEDRTRIVNSVLTLFGEPTAGGGGGGGGTGGGGTGGGGDGGPAPDVVRQGARAYFDGKDPKGKNEEFATAARFHELAKNGAPATKADFERIIATEARRNFHRLNFGRDIDNAQRAKFFNAGSSDGGYTLSHVGQKYVDALPDRTKAKAVKKSAKGTKPRKAKAKAKVKPAART
jgi:hypothetical protein